MYWQGRGINAGRGDDSSKSYCAAGCSVSLCLNRRNRPDMAAEQLREIKVLSCRARRPRTARISLSAGESRLFP